MNTILPRTLKSADTDVWDVVVVGAGAAGLMTCIELPEDLSVLLLNRNQGRRSSSRWAQGGIAAVTSTEDSLDSHFKDTLKAGAGICDENVVRMFVQTAPECVYRLQELGMQFDTENGFLSTTLEAAHSYKRVLHVKDRTGKALIDVLLDQAEKRKNFLHKRGVRVTQLLVKDQVCSGVQILHGSTLKWIRSRAVVLATGGGGHLFANTTNPSQACGEGIALAWHAGAVIEDLEFIQFHPTALKLDGAPCFLLSEALRGEGAVLIDSDGNSPVSHLEGLDLAPRDQVSKALVHSMKNQNVNSFGLDLRKISTGKLESRFPHILKNCRELGIDPIKEPIPIAPAAHYWMGGVATNMNASTNIKGLFAVGEVASTGLHGANRLASNSLMECIVFARKMAEINLDQSKLRSIAPKYHTNHSANLKLHGNWTSNSLMVAIQKLRNLCWIEAGVNRSGKGMQYALDNISKEIDEILNQPLLQFMYSNREETYEVLNDNARRDLNLILDYYHRLITSKLLFSACLFRNESRGGHYREDRPIPLPYWKCHSQQKFGRDLFTRNIIRN